MLNKSGERELAYIVKIDAVDPIPGYDRIECATVNGWHCVVGKGMAAGDLAVYFEIDSLLPATDERFAFCEKYKYRIKTQRMCKGAVISQGLVMPLSDFPELAGCAEGDFVTKRLGVKYYEPEDNVRKAPSVDKYKKMATRHQKLFSKRPIRWLMRRDWGKRLLFIFFGKKRDRKTGWPAWVTKTDEERCLAGQTMIETDHGPIHISEIVNRKLEVNVKSINLSTGEIEYKPIVGFQKYKRDHDMYDVEFVQYNKGDTKKNRVVCTGDHKLYTQRGWVCAKDLSEKDTVMRSVPCLSENAFDVLCGILLGDGGVRLDKRNEHSRLRFTYTQNADHDEYFSLINRALGDNKIYTMKSGYTGKYNIRRFGFCDQACERALYESGAVYDGEFHITDALIQLVTPLSLAVWYMDDGTLRHRDDGLSCSGEISTNAFTKDENMLLLKMLSEKFGIEARLRHDQSRDYYSIYITANGIKTLGRTIAQYVPSCMRYKLPKEIDCSVAFCENLWPTAQYNEKMIGAPITSITKFVDHNHSIHLHGVVYDIEVADNHNFFANGVLTHNCQNVPWLLNTDESWVVTEKIDGTSTTFTIRRRKWPRKNEFYICSRNVVFDSDGNGNCFYDTNVYIEMADEYHMHDVLEKMLDERPDEAWITIQGETYGAGVQKRNYNMGGRAFAAFNLVYSTVGRVGSTQMEKELSRYGIPCVPILGTMALPKTVDEMVSLSNGVSMIDGGMREGLVCRSLDGTQSFKAVSPEYLLKYHG